MSINYLKKSIYRIFCVVTILFVTFSSNTAHAQIAVPVMEVGSLLSNTVAINLQMKGNALNTGRLSAKETGIGWDGTKIITGAEIAAQTQISADSIALKIGKSFISSFTTSIVKWINSGFDGGPLFVTDPAKFFAGAADRAAGNFLESSELGFLCKPFKIPLLLAINLNYSYTFKEKIGCTLTDVINNIDGATASFEDIGWDGWFSITQNPQNNLYGASITVRGELASRVANVTEKIRDELFQAGGFLSTRKCEVKVDGECKVWGPVRTPGKVIEDQLSDSLGTTLSELQIADEFDEIIAALLNQAVQKIVTSSSGLSGGLGS